MADGLEPSRMIGTVFFYAGFRAGLLQNTTISSQYSELTDKALPYEKGYVRMSCKIGNNGIVGRSGCKAGRRTMKIAIIADDLTGASDTGIQAVVRGIPAAVRLRADGSAWPERECVAFDTDSRSDSPETARRKVAELCEKLLPLDPGLVYKKIDSTLRGNVGAEIDAAYDALKPDVLVIAPAYPDNGRTVRDGILYVDGVPLHQTDAARDPKTPVRHSHVPTWLGSQTKRKTGHVSADVIKRESGAAAERIRELVAGGCPYVTFDAECGDDLDRIVNAVHASGLRALWCGSAGLAGALFGRQGRSPRDGRMAGIGEREPLLLVAGSISERTRNQLDRIVRDGDVAGIELASSRLLQVADEEAEIGRACGQVTAALREGKHAALFLSSRADEIERARELGARLNLDAKAVGRRLARALGNAASGLIREAGVRKLVLVGGDTTRGVLLSLGFDELELIDEVESGVPLIRFGTGRPIHAVTKSGGFGDERILQRLIHYLTGG